MSRSANDEHSETDPHWQQARSQLFGMIMEGRSFSGRERNCFFLNTGRQRFATGRPTLVNLWASWCHPCIEELADLTSNRQRLDAAGLHVIALSVDSIGQDPTPAKDVEAVRLDPSSAGAHNNLGIVLAMQRKLAAAGRCFQQAVQLDNDFAEAHANLGNVYAAGGDVQRAARHYQRAIEIDPSNVDPYNNLGTMFGRQGDIRKAIEYYQRALRVDPNHRDTRRNLDRALQLWKSRPKPAASE